MPRRFAISSLLFAAFVPLAACTTFDPPDNLDQDVQSLNTPEMDQAIRSAQGQPPAERQK
jgi:hypothetical protein